MSKIISYTKLLYLGLILIISTSGSIIAQNSEEFEATVEINTQVIQSIELITISNIRLRNFQPDEERIYISPIEDPYAGHIIALGNPNADIRVEYLPTRILTQINGEGILRFEYQVSGSLLDNQITSELLLNDNRNLTFGPDGRFYLWIGGSVDISEAKPGNYQGEFTIEIEYI